MTSLYAVLFLYRLFQMNSFQDMLGLRAPTQKLWQHLTHTHSPIGNREDTGTLTRLKTPALCPSHITISQISVTHKKTASLRTKCGEQGGNEKWRKEWANLILCVLCTKQPASPPSLPAGSQSPPTKSRMSAATGAIELHCTQAI